MPAIQVSEQSDMSKVVSFRDARAKRIRELSQRWADNTIALGNEFKAARDSFPETDQGHRPGWAAWLKSETGWTTDHVARLIKVAEKFSGRLGQSGLTLSGQVLMFLARDASPDSGVNEVISRAKRGEVIGITRAKEIVQPHLPTRSQAIKQARETGRLTPARDGKIYSGASEDEMAAYSDRRSAVFGVERAVKAIAEVGLTPKQWVDAAEDHWIADFDLGNLDRAISFLTKLKPYLEKRMKVVSQ